MNDDHLQLRRLVLSMDDLDAPERERAQSHVDTCPDCAALLRQLRAHEQAPARIGASADAMLEAVSSAASQPRLAADELRAADASLAALKARVLKGPVAPARDAAAAGTSRPMPATRGASRRWWVWAAPLAAAAALIVWLRAPGGGALESGSLRLERAGVQRGVGSTAGADAWHTGDAFQLHFELRRPAHPVVLHVDPAGRVAVLFPDDPEDWSGPAYAAGSVVLPTPGSGEEWVLEGDVGTETFLIAAPARPPSALGALLDRAQRAGEKAPSRAQSIEALRLVLERGLGPVGVVQVQHQP